MKRRAGAVLVVVLGLSAPACHGVVTPSLPRASLSHDGPVAVGTRLALGTSWRGECEEPGFHYEASNQQRTTACRHVDHDVTIACDDDACTWRLAGDALEVVPTKPGALRVHATLTPRDRGALASKTITLGPIEVAVPDVATARCVLWRDRSARLTVTLAAGKTRLHHAAAVAIRGGAACVWPADDEVRRDPGVGEYRCPIESENFAIEITETEARNDGSAVKVYGLETQVACRVALPTPGDRDAGATTTFVLDRTASSEPRAEVVRRSRDRLEMWKWKVGTITQTDTTTTITAARAGSTVAIDLTEAPGDEGPVYTWSYRVLAGHVVGAHEVPGWEENE